MMERQRVRGLHTTALQIARSVQGKALFTGARPSHLAGKEAMMATKKKAMKKLKRQHLCSVCGKAGHNIRTCV